MNPVGGQGDLNLGIPSREQFPIQKYTQAVLEII